MRLLLVADLLRRSIEGIRRRNTALVLLTNDRPPTTRRSEQGIYLPPGGFQVKSAQLSTGSAEVAMAFSSGSFDTIITSSRPADQLAGRRILRVGAVSSHAGSALHEIVADLINEDPLALKLALLRFHHESPAELSRARAHRAIETLQRWRFKVAGWHDMPRTKPAQQLLTMQRALATNLDSATVLNLMHRIETDPRQPSGYKYAAFRDIDRILALNLGYLIGKRRG
ncbi:hypothetical protein GCM10027613_19030 [Microlunatus endophyticus]|nr:hypothetical protein [Microlunatus endophyticus]